MDLGQDPAIQQLIARIDKGNDPVIGVQGTWGSFSLLLVAYLFKRCKRPVLYICAHIDDADRATDDLLTFGVQNVHPLPAWEGEEDFADATDEIRAARLGLVLALMSGEQTSVVPSPVQALCQPIPQAGAIMRGILRLAVDQAFAPAQLIAWLVDNGFEGVDRIDLPGQFAHRGGIVDIFAPVVAQMPRRSQAALALRIEFFGDIIESIRQVNLDTHRSTEKFQHIGVVSATAGTGAADVDLFIRGLPSQTLVVLEEPTDCQDVATVYRERVDNPERLYAWTDIHQALAGFQQLHVSRFGPGGGEPIQLAVQSVQRFQHKAVSTWTGHKAALEELVAKARAGKEVRLYCESAAELTRIQEILAECCPKLPDGLQLIRGFVHRGFTLESLNTILIGHHELFGQYALRRQQRPLRASAPVDSLADLQTGDYVVHASYGIGKYLGIKTIEAGDSRGEYLTLAYADDIKIQVSVSNIALVQKYIGTSPKRPKLGRIGSKKWQKQKDKVAESVRDMAAELLQVQAEREASGGSAFAPDSTWQTAFEESFPYQETADQSTSIAQIKGDMERCVAMDRLLCGDVGYGKTEVAMRAAFKAVDNGKQVAVLVPTTVLCVQHGRTFTERFADFPISIEVLNRFKSAKQAAQIVERTRQGRLDILIGTHRLLSKDVCFKDLGLLIIDEEQRFGVEHKERLKRMRIDVDILTMSATPIPRTLHMSLLGLRDISSLSTPPLDRRSVVTRVVQYNRQTIRQAILRELNRNGQVFFLHNRVQSIGRKAEEIRKLLKDTDARIRVAHGQMSKRELEGAMIDFVEGRADVLVCTTIIESGLDIPNANTIVIDSADRFGLAELHQLRGRVGRYRHRAYAYMLLPSDRSVSPIAAKRLKAIEEYSHLGAGFRIALRDLEIRGAGNILGAEQSGHIQLVGYQMYCEMMAAAVRRLKHEPEDELPHVVLDLGFATYIPKNYIAADRQRMDVYRRIAKCRTAEALAEISEELADVYGQTPVEVKGLLELTRIRIRAGQLGLKRIAVQGPHLVFSFSQATSDRAHALFARVKGTVRVRDAHTIAVQLPSNYFEPKTLMMLLRKILRP